MARLPPYPNIRFDDNGLIHGDDFGDSYFSRDDGLAETQAVFLSGNDLPNAWSDKTQFVIGELGFGTGLNILATWALWAQTASANATLHIITLEGFLMDAAAARAAHSAWPQLGPLSEKLLQRWPTRAHGLQRIWFEEERLSITFLIGPCDDMLARVVFKADCWFLDGFAPSKNPHMWSPSVFAQIARLSKPHATLATYSVAGAVRAGLTSVGFDVRRVPGFGSKRERLEATFHAPCGLSDATKAIPKTALVIGGGIAGAAMCEALSRRNITTHLIDHDPNEQTKASGNPVAMIMPRLDKAETREARFFRSAYLMACDHYQRMAPDCFEQTGVIEFGADDDAKLKLQDTLDDPPLPACHLERGDGATVVHVQGGIAYPDAVLKHLKGQAVQHGLAVHKVVQVDGQWCAMSKDNTIIASADICVIAAGTGVEALCDFQSDLRGRAGQLSLARIDGDMPDAPVSGGGYALPFGELLSFGATYEPCDLVNANALAVTEAAHIYNKDLLADFAPDLAERINMSRVTGRTSIRVTTPDNMPIVGRVPQSLDGLFILAAFGSRGFTTAFLCAELIASLAMNEPCPVETEVYNAIAPDRFIQRAIRRRR